MDDAERALIQIQADRREWSVLSKLSESESGRLTLQDLTKEIGVAAGLLQVVVSNLEELNLVKLSSRDGVTRVRVTDAGERALEKRSQKLEVEVDPETKIGPRTREEERA